MISTLLPTVRFSAVALFAAVVTAAVERFKLHHSPGIDAFRLTLPGILLLGRFFSVWDILAYWTTIFAGVLADMRIRSTSL